MSDSQSGQLRPSTPSTPSTPSMQPSIQPSIQPSMPSRSDPEPGVPGLRLPGMPEAEACLDFDKHLIQPIKPLWKHPFRSRPDPNVATANVANAKDIAGVPAFPTATTVRGPATLTALVAERHQRRQAREHRQLACALHWGRQQDRQERIALDLDRTPQA